MCVDSNSWKWDHVHISSIRHIHSFNYLLELNLDVTSASDFVGCQGQYETDSFTLRALPQLSRPLSGFPPRPQVRSCGISDENSNAADFLRVVRYPLQFLIPPNAPQSCAIRSCYNMATNDRCYLTAQIKKKSSLLGLLCRCTWSGSKVPGLVLYHSH
jgi:hypothetical protein